MLHSKAKIKNTLKPIETTKFIKSSLGSLDSFVTEAPGTRIFHLDFLEEWPMPFLMRCRRRFTAMFFFLQHALFAFRALVVSFSLGIDSGIYMFLPSISKDFLQHFSLANSGCDALWVFVVW